MHALTKLLVASLNPKVESAPAASGHLLLRVAVGLMILYTFVVLTLALMGGGRFSLDAWLERRCQQTTPIHP